MQTQSINQNLRGMTSDERKALMVALKEEEILEKKRIENERETYKKLVSEAVSEQFGKLKDLALTIVAIKTGVFDAFESLIKMKSDLYSVKNEQQSHTFTSADGVSIKIGYRVTDGYDDTIDAGVEKVRDFLKSLAKDPETGKLVDAIMRLLARDRKGNLKPSRVIELKQMAEQIGNPIFLDGIKIIEAAYKPVRSCQFVEVTYKNEHGKEISLPLSMSAAE